MYHIQLRNTSDKFNNTATCPVDDRNKIGIHVSFSMEDLTGNSPRKPVLGEAKQGQDSMFSDKHDHVIKHLKKATV